MTIDNTWNIVQLERNTVDGGVTVAHWTLTGVDSETGKSAHNYGTASFTPDPTAEGFVPFENLTKDDVLAWLFGGEGFDKESAEASVANQITELNAPKTVTGTPWNIVVVEEEPTANTA